MDVTIERPEYRGSAGFSGIESRLGTTMDLMWEADAQLQPDVS